MKSFFFIIVSALIVFNASYECLGQVSLAFEESEWNILSEFPVKGRKGAAYNQKLSFSRFYTSNISESWGNGVSSFDTVKNDASTNKQVLSLLEKYPDKDQSLFFALRDSAGLKANVFCLGNLMKDDLAQASELASLFGASALNVANPLYYVQIFTSPDDSPWYLILDSVSAKSSPKTYQTRLVKNRDEFYEITTSSLIRHKKGKVVRLNFDYAGFKIKNRKGEPVAAVSVVNKGLVYLKNVSDQEKLLLAAACAAILLQQEI